MTYRLPILADAAPAAPRGTTLRGGPQQPPHPGDAPVQPPEPPRPPVQPPPGDPVPVETPNWQPDMPPAAA